PSAKPRGPEFPRASLWRIAAKRWDNRHDPRRAGRQSRETRMRYFDFSSWQGILTTVLGLALFALIVVGIRVLLLLAIHQRQQRMNRQISERLRTLIAAYKVLGGSFTGELLVDPTHLRELRQRAAEAEAEQATGSDRARRIRDSVEAALSDIILLGTEEQVRLA